MPCPARRLEHTSRAHEAEARAFLDENRPALPEFRLAQAPQQEFAQVPRALRRHLDRRNFFYRIVERETRPEE